MKIDRIYPEKLRGDPESRMPHLFSPPWLYIWLMDDSLEKLQKIRNEANALIPSDENAHRLELSIREAIRLVRRSEKIDKSFREKCVQDLDYEITHYLHQNYRKAATKGEKNIEFNRARQGAVLAINRAIHRLLNGK